MVELNTMNHNHNNNNYQNNQNHQNLNSPLIVDDDDEDGYDNGGFQVTDFSSPKTR